MHNNQRLGAALAAVIAAVSLAACNTEPPPPPAKNASAEDEAAKNLKVYQDLRDKQSWQLALSIGQDLVKRFPNSPQAAAVKTTLADTEEKAGAMSEQHRVAQLWDYQSGTESGGSQVTASTYSTDPASETEHIRLVLRRHSSWGQSAYLVSPGTGFECAKECFLEVSFDDGKPERFKATLPDTSDPAITIDDNAGFIAKLQQAKKISIELTQKGNEKQTVVFEVAGYDPGKFPESPPAAAAPAT
jgi:hypothetical protein